MGPTSLSRTLPGLPTSMSGTIFRGRSSWFSVGPPVHAWGIGGRQVELRRAGTQQHQCCLHYTIPLPSPPPAPIWTHRKAVNPKFRQIISLLARRNDGKDKIAIEGLCNSIKSSHSPTAWSAPIDFSVRTSWIEVDSRYLEVECLQR